MYCPSLPEAPITHTLFTTGCPWPLCASESMCLQAAHGKTVSLGSESAKKSLSTATVEPVRTGYGTRGSLRETAWPGQGKMPLRQWSAPCTYATGGARFFVRGAVQRRKTGECRLLPREAPGCRTCSTDRDGTLASAPIRYCRLPDPRS